MARLKFNVEKCPICNYYTAIEKEETVEKHEHYVMDMGDFECRTQLRDEAGQESIDQGVPVELHFHPEGNDCRNTIFVCERFNVGISEPIV